jgi:ABC-type branched-subunit amino acid transport system ATPase component
MLSTLRITNFRGLRALAMSGLGRVNLLVGTNNCGKTSVLEAIHLLSAPGDADPLWQAQFRRGEFTDSVSEREVDVAHLVHGHQLIEGTVFAVAGEAGSGRQSVTATFVMSELTPGSAGDEPDDVDGPRAPWAALRLDWVNASASKRRRLRLSQHGGITEGRILMPRAVSNVETHDAVLFVATDGLTRDNVVSMFEGIVLTPDEVTVLEALRTIEPGIERIASVGAHTRSSSRARGGLAMMVAGRRIPIGSMGDGIWRLLGIALALVRARGGVLLVDEIDTGLHYSVLVDMWRLVLETARTLEVQVFATTHSRDCYEALAAVTEAGRGDISLQRIERGKVDAIGFTEAEIHQAAERGLEVR